jgi:hypothetical protein
MFARSGIKRPSSPRLSRCLDSCGNIGLGCFFGSRHRTFGRYFGMKTIWYLPPSLDCASGSIFPAIRRSAESAKWQIRQLRESVKIVTQ